LEIVKEEVDILIPNITAEDICEKIKGRVEREILHQFNDNLGRYKFKCLCAEELNKLLKNGTIRRKTKFMLMFVEPDGIIDNWDKCYMNMTIEASKESKCSAKKVGCLLVRDNNILAIGVNGTFSGAINCNEKFIKENGIWYEYDSNKNKIRCEDQLEHYKWSLIHEVHAEMNALAKANKNGVNVIGATAYITYSPCYNCAKNLYTFGIKRIIYKTPYDDINEVRELLKNFDVQIIKMEG